MDLARTAPTATGGAAGDPEHDGAMAGHGGADGIGGGRRGTGPQVGQSVAARTGLADRCGRGGNGRRGTVLVEQRDRDIAVGQRLGQYIEATAGGDLGALLAQRVLV